MSSESPTLFPERRHWLLLAAGLFALLIFSLGSRGLNEPDEGRYVNIAREMVLSGDWWEPRMSGFGHYDKPPLVYWITALSLRVFGINEWAARLPSLLGALLALTGLGWAAFRLRGPLVAWWAVLICGTSVQFYVLARILSPDMLLTGWCTLAIGAWAECRHRGGAWKWWGISLVFWALAWWTKATPALIPLAGLTLGVVFTRDTAGLRALRIWLLFPMILVLGAAWFLSMVARYPELKQFFFGRELADRMAGRVDGRHGSKLYYLPVSVIAWLPWWPLAVWSAWKTRAGFRPGAGTAALGLEWWIVLVGLAIFSLAASKLPTYTLTLAPWAALGIATWIARALPGARRHFRLESVVAGAFALTVTAVTLKVPNHESSLGVNSSLREVCAYLSKHGAARVEADQYWPSMEFYLGDDVVRYVMKNDRQQERASDFGVTPPRFVEPDPWPALQSSLPQPRDYWLVRFRKRKDSPFDEIYSTSKRAPEAKTIGQFDLFHVEPDESGVLNVLPATP